MYSLLALRGIDIIDTCGPSTMGNIDKMVVPLYIYKWLGYMVIFLPAN